MRKHGTGARSATPRYTVLQGVYWMVYCILVSFSSVYLLARDFSNTQIGLLIGISSVLSALLQPVAASIADRSRRFSLQQFSALLTGVMAVGGAALLFFSAKPLQAACYMLLLVILQILTPFVYSLGMDCVNRGIPLNYGVSRSAGAIAYAGISAVCGVIVKERGAGTIPALLVILTLLLIPVFLTFRFRGREEPKRSGREETAAKEETPFLIKYRRLLPLLAGIVLLFISHNIILSFTYQIILRLGGDSPEMGVVLVVINVVEIPVMVSFSFLLRKASARFWVMLSGVSFFLHALVIWLAPNFPVLYFAQIFEAGGYALYTVAVVYFVNDLVEKSDRIRGQAWFAMTNTLGILLGTSIGGILLDHGGAGVLMAFATATAGGGMLLLFVLLGGKGRGRMLVAEERTTGGQP